MFYFLSIFKITGLEIDLATITKIINTLLNLSLAWGTRFAKG
jgi:hypothetical protein